jgi:integrase/recombinase XerD
MATVKKTKTLFRFELNSRPKKDGKYTILLRYSKDGKKYRISTEVSIEKKHFNAMAKHGCWINTAENRAELNEKLEEKYDEAKEKFNNLKESNKAVTPSLKQIKKALTTEQQEVSDSFLKYFDARIKEAKTEHSVNYWKNLIPKYNKLKHYVENKLKWEDLTFAEMDSEFLGKYKIYLMGLGNKPNTIISNFKDIRAVYYRAILYGKYHGVNAFKNFTVGTMTSHKPKLTTKEIKAIKALELEDGSKLWHSRNYFLFAFFCAGIRVADLMQLRFKNVIGDGERLNYYTSKNEKEINIKLLPAAQDILKNYPLTKKADYIFPILSKAMQKADRFELEKQIHSKTAMINNNLKKIQKLAEIDTNISNHISRHSFAAIAKDRKISVYEIMKFLGHSKISITESYLKELGELPSDTEHEKAMADL